MEWQGTTGLPEFERDLDWRPEDTLAVFGRAHGLFVVILSDAQTKNREVRPPREFSCSLYFAFLLVVG